MKQPSFHKPLSQIIKSLSKDFTLRDRAVSIDEITATDGLLPALVKRSERLAKLCFGASFDVKYTNTDKSLLGYTVSFNKTETNFIMIACIYDALVEISAGSPGSKCSLNELLYD